jgi:hemerythrin superfamily protein
MSREIGKAGQRAPRVKFLGSVLALVELQNHRNVRVRVHQLSVNGGLLQLSDPLPESVGVELVFRVGPATIRGDAEMLFPMWATREWLQPFRFLDLDATQRIRLDNALQPYLKPGGRESRTATSELAPKSFLMHGPENAS